VSGAEERKLATVFFADLVSSTATADGEDPERVRARLERFYDAMAEEIGRTGGTVEKFAGDAVMAAFGAPAALEDHAERALHAALAMQRRLGELFGGELRLRIGVNTGEVVVGQAREASSFVTGDAVNVAARLEQAAEAGEVLAGERTVAAVGGAFEFSEPRLVEAKGKPGGVACRAVLRALSLARPRGAGGFRRVFVGRESELDLLRATFRRTLSQQEPHLVTIVGEPGVGKTTLVRELWEMLAEEEPAPLRRTGRCLPYGDGVTYWPVGEALREHFGLLESDSPREALRRLEGREILGLALGLDVASDLHPRDARERLHASIVEFVEEIASERPLVLLVEDVHWAEDDLLDLLERLVRDARVPVVLVATSRPELFDGRPTWSGGWRNATTIWLDPLPAEVAARMVDEMLALELRPAVRDLVVGRAEGNPFFVEELVGALVDSGVLERRNGGWTVGELPEGFSVPDSVQAVLAARLDRLPTVEKAALQAASVVGRVFWTQPVVHLLDGEEPDFDLLEERDFIRRRAGSAYPAEREYAIKHALTREVAYSSIPKARRGRLHARLADWLDEGEQTGDEYVPLLAYHYAEAVRPEDADLVWGGRRRGAGTPPAPRRQLARTCGQAGAWALRDRGGHRAPHPGRGACRRRSQARSPVARDRLRAGAPLRRRGFLGRDEPLFGGAARRRGARGHVQHPGIPDIYSVGHVARASGARPGRRVDRPRARARHTWWCRTRPGAARTCVRGARGRGSGGRDRGGCARGSNR
jgi:class 3 adenylate cyclase